MVEIEKCGDLKYPLEDYKFPNINQKQFLSGNQKNLLPNLVTKIFKQQLFFLGSN
jgi:hypothetical protein